ncbi:hypothetical protein GCM10011512_14720 [Tersicoccus solisilvae]|uniref:Dephospho-CoA kinase n=1 Tax=Tersicoccus solisilvae TaxID=1882339 RepID=A0ABQ1P8E4_9MICC|nr:dephospho-CoA kinase [Tersicoccus solisilvae]GGC88803.1 hypothetical protein GCM10011512_14720 [Tersicoccus solisilvae]
MLRIGLTGGIAAGKSVVATRLSERGAVLVDADRLSREVVAPGTDGLDAVVDAFGRGVLGGDGSLDRAALGSLVFSDEDARRTLNDIVHPRVRAEAARRIAAAPLDAVIVQDIPLLVETGQADAFPLVVVVQAPAGARVRRMVEQRGMSDADARARMAAQATDAERAAVADVLLHNDGTVEDLRAAVDRLWDERIVPFDANLAAGRPSDAAIARATLASGAGPDLDGAALARAAARIRHAGADSLQRVTPAVRSDDSAAGPDLIAVAARPGDLDALATAVTAAGHPPVPPAGSVPGARRLHGSADPGQPVVVLLLDREGDRERTEP